MTRLSFLRLLGLMPVTQYGSMGQAHRRPDQQSSPPPSAVAPTQAAGIQRARAVVIFGTGPSSGLFVYNGTPALGNPPQVAIVPTGVTADPFGNAITSSKILMQGNVITETSGIFRTAAAAPLIQLDGPHNAVLIYDSSSNLIATETPAAGNDGLGNTFPAGITTFQPGPNRAQNFVQLINNTIVFGLSPNTFSLSPGANGLVVTGAFAHTEQAAPSAIGSGPQVFGSNVTGMLRTVADNTKGDSNTYDVARLILPATATPQTISSTTATTITGCSLAVVAIKYTFRARVTFSGGAAAGTANFSVTGPANTGAWINAMFLMTTPSSGAAAQNASLGPVNSPTLSTGNNVADIEGEVTFTAAGTIALACAEGTAGDTVIIQKAHFWLFPAG